MKLTRARRISIGAATATAAIVAGSAVLAGPGVRPSLTDVATANTKSDGYAPASKLSRELRSIVHAQGSTRVENPTALTSYYGYDNDVLNSAGEPQMVPTKTSPANEATKTEPDKNTYLAFRQGLPGADGGYDYGTHYVFQGHENGAGGAGYITRINLDADAAHRVTVLATTDTAGKPLTTIDGSTWDPWAQRLLFTTESPNKPTYAATPGFPSVVEDVSGALGRGGYEGIQNDRDGNIWIVEDIGGPAKPGTTAKIPNSFLYRYVPASKGDLHNGRLQALQVVSPSGQPITKASQTPVSSPDQLALHIYGSAFATRWVTVHDTATDGTAPFDANTAATARDATPFKRPENGVFRPDGSFTQFLFDETGDTNATSVENDNAGGWGSVLELTQPGPSAPGGSLSIFYKGNQEHAGFDNMNFLTKGQLTVVEDAGDTLHTQRNALDSGFAFDLGTDYATAGTAPIRWLAQGRDPSATIDSSYNGFGKNDGDNEITGDLISDGDPGPGGILGAKPPTPFKDGWRWFYTQQHGDNVTYEVVPADSHDQGDSGDGNHHRS